MITMLIYYLLLHLCLLEFVKNSDKKEQFIMLYFGLVLCFCLV